MNKEIKIVKKLEDYFSKYPFLRGDKERLLVYTTVISSLRIKFNNVAIMLTPRTKKIVIHKIDNDRGYRRDVVRELNYDFENSYENLREVLTKKIMETYE